MLRRLFFKSNFIEPVIFENISIFKLILTEITAHNDSEKYEIEFKTLFIPIPKLRLNLILFLEGVLLHNKHFLGVKDG